MSDNKETKLVEDYSRHDECFEDPPPAYSSARNSCVSSEISLFTIEPDFAPEFTNDSRDLENYCAAAGKTLIVLWGFQSEGRIAHN